MAAMNGTPSQHSGQGCSREADPRLPLGPLADRLGVDLALGRGDRGDGDEARGAPALALLCGVSVRQVWRWISDGLSLDTADRVAVSCGVQPEAVWPEWLADVDERPSRWCSCPAPVVIRRRCDRCDGLLHPVRHRRAVDAARQGSLFDPGEAT